MNGEAAQAPWRQETVSPAAASMFESDGASRALGIELLRASGGEATVRMLVTAAMVNGHAIAHGGYIFLLADTAFACACNSHGPVTVAAGADITFVTSAHEGDVLLASVREQTRYGRSGIYDVTVHREPGDGRRGGDVIAEFRGRSRVIRGASTEARAET